MVPSAGYVGGLGRLEQTDSFPERLPVLLKAAHHQGLEGHVSGGSGGWLAENRGVAKEGSFVDIKLLITDSAVLPIFRRRRGQFLLLGNLAVFIDVGYHFVLLAAQATPRVRLLRQTQ